MDKNTMKAGLVVLIVAAFSATTVFAQPSVEDQLSNTGAHSVTGLVEAWSPNSNCSSDSCVLLSVSTATRVNTDALEGIDGISWRRLNLAGDTLRVTLYGQSDEDTRGILDSDWLIREALLVDYRVMSNNLVQLIDCGLLSQEKAPRGGWHSVGRLASCDADTQGLLESIRRLAD